MSYHDVQQVGIAGGREGGRESVRREEGGKESGREGGKNLHQKCDFSLFLTEQCLVLER